MPKNRFFRHIRQVMNSFRKSGSIHGFIQLFESGTFEKSPEKPIFAGKTVFFEFFELYFIFFHEILHTDAKWQYLKCDGAQFSKNNFSGWKCRKCSGKTGFLAFSRDFLISFFWYIEQKSYGPAIEKDFFYAENAGNRRFYRFSLDFFLTLRCLFT